MTWKKQKVPKVWTKDYGTVRAWNKNGKATQQYIQIDRIKKDDNFRKKILSEGYKYEIASNRFGSSHHKTLASAETYAKKLMKVK